TRLVLAAVRLFMEFSRDGGRLAAHGVDAPERAIFRRALTERRSTAVDEQRAHHCSVSMKRWISLSKSCSLRRISSIFLIEWITVEWCLPPNRRPISGSDLSVSVLQRYIAIWRGKAIGLALFLDLSWATLSLNW